MDFSTIVGRIARLFGRKAAKAGVKKGADIMAKRSPAKAGPPAHTVSARDVSKRARAAARITRRNGR